MPVFFRTFRSSSAGNCLALWTADSSVLIDFGVKTLRDCRAILRDHQDRHGPVNAVLVSHAHGDHLSRDGVRVLRETGIPVHGHTRVVPQLRERHGLNPHSDHYPLHAVAGDRFSIGDFDISTMPLPHAPGIPNVGFVIRAGHGSNRRTIVVATDFHDFASLLPHLPGADFVFVEANHDLELLRRHSNPNSRWHLSNVKTASLLCRATLEGGFAPRAVVLGHLSDERNRETLAVGEVRRAFEAQGLRVPFELEAAPKFEPSRVFQVD
jgi:phosphoribosyl 1,2-cyclic phosphodiesterase